MRAEFHLTPGRTCIIAREGWVFIFLFGVVSILFFVFGLWFFGLALIFLTLFTVYFFRNPERVGPVGHNLIVAPADGRVVEVSEIKDNPYTNGPAKKVGIFMSIFDVHVNRAPISGVVEDIKYHPGKFLVASRDKASTHNERNAILLDAGRDFSVAVVQIAGLVARRIVCYFERGLNVKQGERLGLIRFGSRVDVYLPPASEVDVSCGDRVTAGMTIIGRLE